MLVQDVNSAQITIILASNDDVQAGQLRRDLLASKFVYFFVVLRDRVALVDVMARHIATNGGKTPIVIVLDHKFAMTDCDIILAAICGFPNAESIASVVINPPMDHETRERLKAAGARLYDGGFAEVAKQFTLQ